jgi:hypothetical protein
MLLAAISLHLLCSTLEQPIAKFAAAMIAVTASATVSKVLQRGWPLACSFVGLL